MSNSENSFLDDQSLRSAESYAIYRPVLNEQAHDGTWTAAMRAAALIVPEAMVRIHEDDFRVSLIPGDLVQAAVQASDAIHAPYSEISRVINDARKEYSGFMMHDVRVQPFIRTISDRKKGTESVALSLSDSKLADETFAVAEKLGSELGVYINLKDLPTYQPIVLAEVETAAPTNYISKYNVLRLMPNLVGAAQSIRPASVDLGPLHKH